MRIPSYDDLETSIPDVESGDLLAIERLMPPSGPVAAAASSSPAVHPPQLFACLYSPHAADLALAIAKEFSPRYQRHGADSVVVDVSGLGRLLGDADAIGVELARAASPIDSHATTTRDAAGAACGPRATDAAPPPVPRATSRYGIRIEPQPLEAGGPGPHPATSAAPRTPRRSRIGIGVASTQIAALLLARTGVPLVVSAADPAASLGELPLDMLRQLLAGVHGASLYRRPAAGRSGSVSVAGARGGQTTHPSVSPAGWPPWPSCEQAFDTLARWGLRTLGEFAALPSGDLSARLGQAGVRLQALARGIDPRPLVPEPDAPLFVQRMELDWPIEGLEPLSFVLARLLDPLTAALERADRAAAALRLDLRLTDRTTHRRVLQLPSAIRDARVFRTLLTLDLESHPPPAAIDVVTIEIDPAPARVLQYSLLEPATASAETLATLTARLHALVGDVRCGSAGLPDTHRPDAFEMRPFAPASRPAAAGAPGHFAAGSACLRRFRPPVAIRVTVAHGRPVHVAIDRRGMPGGRVAQSAGPWRTSGAWWDARGDAWNRDEWDVTFDDGTTVRVFCDRVTGTWFMEAIMD